MKTGSQKLDWKAKRALLDLAKPGFVVGPMPTAIDLEDDGLKVRLAEREDQWIIRQAPLAFWVWCAMKADINRGIRRALVFGPAGDGGLKGILRGKK